MNLLDKKEHYINLFDFYEELLNDKQKKYFREYYFQDFSLGEMAENYQVTRNAIYDHLRKIAALLDLYEEKLGLLEKYSLRKSIYDQANKENPEINEIITKLKEIE
ncbi:MAG: hypothetical protein PHX62_06875 [Bacilli bacterium]|nr:hypothetical protein [Bacilli bacterium]